MQLTEEAKEVISKLKPHVTGFSEGFRLSGKDKEEVVCGGKVTQIVDMSNWSHESQKQLVYVTIDDAVGELLILVPNRIWEDSGAKKQDLVLGKGVLYALPKDSVFYSKAGTQITVERSDEPIRVLMKSIQVLSN